MAQIETWLNQDMMQAVKVRYLDGNLFSQDNAGNMIGVKLTRDGVDYSGGGTVSANVIRSDGGTVAVTGALSGNVATIVLPQSAYAVPGVVSIVVKLTVSGEVTTIAAVVANIYQSSTETAIDPGTIIPSIQTLINQINTAVASIPADYSSLWATLAPAFSTSTAYTIGQYVTYDGGLYRFTSAHPAGEWSASDVTAAVVGNVLTDLQTGKADKTDPVFYGTISKGRKGGSQAGTGSVALGDNVTANGWFSQAEGQGTIANGSYQRASGKYNVADTGNTYAEIVGNGYAEIDPQTFVVTEHRSNARTLDWNGNETIAGDLTVNKGTANEVTLGSEVSNLKNEIDSLEGGATGQVLRKKSGTDFDVEWASVAQPTDAQVAEAVDDWLDDHPEATTTVQDGSLTEVKFTDATQLKVLNNYATPEMFGAKGDGTTDDTGAIQDMFDSEYTTFVFGNKTYLVDGSIDVDSACNIHFNRTKFKVKGSSASRDYEYVLAFKAPYMHTYGELTIDCKTSVNIGIYLQGCGNSEFDSFVVTDARIWGISTDVTTEANNGMIFNSVWVARCGYKVTAKAKYYSGTRLDITNIACSKTYFSNIINDLFSDTYKHCELLIDDSGYIHTENFFGTYLPVQHNRLVHWNNSGSNPFTLDESDPTTGVYEYPSGSVVKSDYVDGDDPRNVLIPIGGGINLQSRVSEGVYVIGKLTTQSCPVGARLMLPYGGSIGTYISEYDTIVMQTNAMGLDIAALYNEATGNGYNYKFNNGYDKIICLTYNGNQKVNVGSTIINTPFIQGNCVVYDWQYTVANQLNNYPLKCTQYEAGLKCSGTVIDWPNHASSMEVNEFTPSELTIDSPYYSTTVNQITINLVDPTAFKTNRFQPMHIYVRQRVATATSENTTFKITLKTALANAGYSIEGATNGVYTVAPYDYGNYVKITIVLFPYDKKFHVYAEQISASNYQNTSNLVTSLSNASTDTQYPSAKCVYDIIGDVETLLSGI